MEAISENYADGIILSPFSTPRVAVPRNPSASDVAAQILGLGGEVLFDAMTHARFLTACNKLDFYDEWELWDSSAPDLETDALQLAHIERVFKHQERLRVPTLAPTIQVSSPHDSDARLMKRMAQLARGLDPGCWQSLAGTRSFWSSGSYLDAFVGELAALRSHVWILTVTNELVVDNVPDLSDIEAFSGLCRTIHSFSERSRVIVTHCDFGGLPAVAAGADTIGSGWDRGQRTFDPLSFHVDSEDSIRRAASYVTQSELQAVLRRDTAEAIERLDASLARRIRGGGMPPSDNVERMQHLAKIRAIVHEIDQAAARKERVDRLRARYVNAT